MHAAAYAAEYVTGFQGEEGGFLKSGAMAKHFAAYDQASAACSRSGPCQHGPWL